MPDSIDPDLLPPPLPPEPPAPEPHTMYREPTGSGRFVLPWDPGHRVRQCVESGGAIDAREATWLLAELDRLHQLEVAMADNERAGDRLGDAVASARAADPRGGR